MYCRMLTGINTTANTAPRCCHKDCILLEGSLHLFTEQYAVYCSNHETEVVFLERESLHITVHLAHSTPHVALWAGTTAAYLMWHAV